MTAHHLHAFYTEPAIMACCSQGRCHIPTQVTEGSGRMLVTATGLDSEWGKTLALVVCESPDTPLQEKLSDLAGSIGKVGAIVALVTFIVLLVRCVKLMGWARAASPQSVPGGVSTTRAFPYASLTAARSNFSSTR